MIDMNDAAHPISKLLAGLGSDNECFATRFTLNSDPQLHIDGVGSVSLPITQHMAHRLCAVAQPAMHGYKNQTLLDPGVRDTWEIPASAIRMDSPDWQAVLERSLKRIQADLQLPANTRLSAGLHNLLVYGPGQFFVMHQDSEKAPGMIGSLVITLPSPFTGGDFIISHQGQKLSSRGSASKLGMVAFYADCYHEVRPVKQGYRVVLTYNLIAQGHQSHTEVPEQQVTALAAALKSFWNTPTRGWGGVPGTPPDRLVYLLDHQYTQSGLSWKHLKGNDSLRAAALRQAARRLDAEIFLSLADVHEVWSTEDDYVEDGYDEWEEKDEEDEDALPEDKASEALLQDLIDSDIELRHWVSVDGSETDLNNSTVGSDELCLTRKTVDFQPFESQYEGYMGNYGNTVDRWYHRAAVVVWPRGRTFVINARQSSDWGITQINRRFDAGDTAQALAWLHDLLPLWKPPPSSTSDPAFLKEVLQVVTRLDDTEAILILLEPFIFESLRADQAPWLLQLLERRGLDWWARYLAQWIKSYRSSEEQLDWITQALPALVQTLGTEGLPLSTALLEGRWKWLQSHLWLQQSYGSTSSAIHEQVQTGPALLALIHLSDDARWSGLQEKILRNLVSSHTPITVVMAILRTAIAKGTEVRCLGLLHLHCVQTLTAQLATPERAADNWSIQPPAIKNADVGATLTRFLAAADKKRLEWPLAEASRKTIHRLIEQHELPVSHETRRAGRPYTLILQKTQALFEREAAERRQWASDLEWLLNL